MSGFVLTAALVAGTWLQPSQQQDPCAWVAGPAHDYCVRSDDEVQPAKRPEPFTAVQAWTLTGAAGALAVLSAAWSVRAGRTKGREPRQ